MASSTAFASLAVPVFDDSMELTTSPRVSHADNDIDLDLDDYGVVQFTDDERMMEDPQPPRPGTADDMMEDAEQAASMPIAEEVMQDDPVNTTSYDDDEELIDYSDDEYEEDMPVANEVAITQDPKSSFLAPIEAVTEPEQVDEEIVRDSEHVAVEKVSAPSEFPGDVPPVDANGGHAPDLSADDAGDALDKVAAEDLSAQDAEDFEQATTLVSESADLSPATVTAEAEPEDEASLVDNQRHAVDEGDEAARKVPGSLDTSTYYPPDGPGTPSDTGMHPMTVRYGDLVMPLFKSRAQPGGLLKDDNLASLSINNLLTNCRQRLESKMGESISTDQDLVVSFETMGLIVSENSPYSFERSLSEILDVYIQLHQNDGAEIIPPLALSLSLQLKFPSSFNLLKMAAQQGQGMSSFSFLRNDDGNEAYYEEQEGDYVEEEGQEYVTGEDEDSHRHSETAAQGFVDGEISQQAQEGQEYEEEHEAEYEEGNEYEGQDWDEYPEDPQQASTPNNGRDTTEDQQYEAPTDRTYEDFSEQNQEESFNLHHDHGSSASDPAADGTAYPASQRAEDHTTAESDASKTQLEQEQAKFARPESIASSATIPNDVPNDATGEYKFEEDLIDYEDDDLTSWSKENQADDGEDELAALANELEEAEEAADTTAHPQDSQQATEVSEGDAGNEYTFDFDSRDHVDTHEEEEELIDYPSDDEDQPYPAADGSINPLANDGNGNTGHVEASGVQGVPEGDDNAAFDLLEDHEVQAGTVDDAAVGQPVGHDYSAEYDEDRIDFEEDDEVVQPQPVATTSNSNSPLGKRSFDEHENGNADATSEQPDLKKARAG